MTSSAESPSTEVVLDGGVLRVVIAGTADAEVLLRALAEMAELERREPSTSMLLDFSAVETLRVRDDDMFRIVTALRTRLPHGSAYRCAVVAPAALAGVLGVDFVQVRDLLAGGDDVADVRPFPDVVAARAWLDAP